MNVTESVKSARRVSVPILAINTPDQAATVATLVAGVNGNTPKVQWDFVRGFRPLNDEGAAALAGCGDDAEDATANPTGAVSVANKLPEGTMVFIHNANRYLDDAGFVQAVGNIRDQFKQDRRMLILMGPSVTLPVELAGDVIVVDEPLPSPADIERIILDVHEAAGIEVVPETLAKAVSATTGLPAFQVEQITAMSLTPDGLVVEDLWQRKLMMIGQTKGLTAYMGGKGFDDIGGCSAAKQRATRLVNGRRKANAVVWVEEGEKAFAGAGSDLSGVADDALGTLLTEMEEQKAMGFIFVGHPGTAKSAMAKAIGAEFSIPTIRFDLGAMQGSLVGESQHALRNALKVVRSVSNGNALWVMTCNNLTKLPAALLRRFRQGIYFFDLPTADERELIWDLYLGQYQVEQDIACETFDEGWTGAEIEQCVVSAYNEMIPLSESRHDVVPQCVTAAEGVENLRKFANQRLLSAAHRGFYQHQPKSISGRSIDLK